MEPSWCQMFSVDSDRRQATSSESGDIRHDEESCGVTSAPCDHCRG